jgi:hypothetical protein
LILIFFFFNFKPKPMARGARGGAKAAPASSPPKRAASSSGKRGRADASQEVIHEAAADADAADAAAEAAALHVDSEGEEDNGAGGSKKSRGPEGLLQRRLDKANADNTSMANKIAELEKRLTEKDDLPVAVSPRHETGSNAALKVAL